MSHFYGSMQGSRGQATRCGTPKSGIDAHIRGWKIGARVRLRVDADGRDIMEVYKTAGSGSHAGDKLIGVFKEKT